MLLGKNTLLICKGKTTSLSTGILNQKGLLLLGLSSVRYSTLGLYFCVLSSVECNVYNLLNFSMNNDIF